VDDYPDQQPEATEPPGDVAESAPAGVREPSERERELAALASLQGDLADVDRALARLDEGTYGTCEVCGEAIPDDVLERVPVTRVCAAHDAEPAPRQ
jgi:RNA polymerase-binding transcription factor DksA